MRSVALLLVALSVTATARAAAPLCSAVTEQPPNASGTYLVLRPVGNADLYLETNDEPGLQRQPCEPTLDAVPVPADTLLVEVAGIRAE